MGARRQVGWKKGLFRSCFRALTPSRCCRLCEEKGGEQTASCTLAMDDYVQHEATGLEQELRSLLLKHVTRCCRFLRAGFRMGPRAEWVACRERLSTRPVPGSTELTRLQLG